MTTNDAAGLNIKICLSCGRRLRKGDSKAACKGCVERLTRTNGKALAHLRKLPTKK